MRDCQGKCDPAEPCVASVQSPQGAVSAQGLGRDHIDTKLDFLATSNIIVETEGTAVGLHFRAANILECGSAGMPYSATTIQYRPINIK